MDQDTIEKMSRLILERINLQKNSRYFYLNELEKTYIWDAGHLDSFKNQYTNYSIEYTGRDYLVYF